MAALKPAAFEPLENLLDVSPERLAAASARFANGCTHGEAAMLRNSNDARTRRFLGAGELVPAFFEHARPAAERRCPECRETYDVRDRYCPRCHTATPEWRYG